jgi:hypothetical protein
LVLEFFPISCFFPLLFFDFFWFKVLFRCREGKTPGCRKRKDQEFSPIYRGSLFRWFNISAVEIEAFKGIIAGSEVGYREVFQMRIQTETQRL